ncbi:MAG: DUF7678 domain-containing protein [Phycisphaerales bacterium]
MTNEPTPWNMYKQDRVNAIEERGYTVRDNDPRDNWVQVGRFGPEQANSYLSASVQFFQEPSHYGINDGRISRMDIRRYHRPTCRELFDRVKSRGTAVFAYDRGDDIDRLSLDKQAEKFYKDLIDLLN